MADTATIADFEKEHRAPSPRAPMTSEDAGLGPDQISQLFVKALYTGEATGVEIADRLRLVYQMLEPLIEQMRAERLIEVRGTTGQGSASYRYALTDLGRDRGRQYLDANSYVGPAPVPLATYVREMKASAAGRGFVSRGRLRGGVTHLLLDDQSPVA